MTPARHEPWHLVTRGLGILNTVLLAMVAFFSMHMVDDIYKRLDNFANKQEQFDSRLSMIQGQCCRKSFIETQEVQNGS